MRWHRVASRRIKQERVDFGLNPPPPHARLLFPSLLFPSLLFPSSPSDFNRHVFPELWRRGKLVGATAFLNPAAPLSLNQGQARELWALGNYINHASAKTLTLTKNEGSFLADGGGGLRKYAQALHQGAGEVIPSTTTRRDRHGRSDAECARERERERSCLSFLIGVLLLCNAMRCELIRLNESFAHTAIRLISSHLISPHLIIRNCCTNSTALVHEARISEVSL